MGEAVTEQLIQPKHVHIGVGGNGVRKRIQAGDGLVLRDPLPGFQVEANVKILVLAAGEKGALPDDLKAKLDEMTAPYRAIDAER